jgi:hypothetical protein
MGKSFDEKNIDAFIYLLKNESLLFSQPKLADLEESIASLPVSPDNDIRPISKAILIFCENNSEIDAALDSIINDDSLVNDISGDRSSVFINGEHQSPPELDKEHYQTTLKNVIKECSEIIQSNDNQSKKNSNDK